MERRVAPLAESIGMHCVLPCDVGSTLTQTIPPRSTTCSPRSRERLGSIDFVVHAVALSDRGELAGRYADTTRSNFIKTMLVSCFSFTETMKRAAALMPDGGSAMTLSYIGACG